MLLALLRLMRPKSATRVAARQRCDCGGDGEYAALRRTDRRTTASRFGKEGRAGGRKEGGKEEGEGERDDGVLPQKMAVAFYFRKF